MPTPQRPDRRSSRRPHLEQDFQWKEGWAQPQPPRTRRGPLTPEQQRAAARRARERRRRRRRTLVVGTIGGILLLSGIITLLLPKSVTGEAPVAESTPTGSTQLVAPLPYGGSTDTAATPAALNWGTVGPTQQNGEHG